MTISSIPASSGAHAAWSTERSTINFDEREMEGALSLHALRSQSPDTPTGDNLVLRHKEELAMRQQSSSPSPISPGTVTMSTSPNSTSHSRMAIAGLLSPEASLSPPTETASSLPPHMARSAHHSGGSHQSLLSMDTSSSIEGSSISDASPYTASRSISLPSPPAIVSAYSNHHNHPSQSSMYDFEHSSHPQSYARASSAYAPALGIYDSGAVVDAQSPSSSAQTFYGAESSTSPTISSPGSNKRKRTAGADSTSAQEKDDRSKAWRFANGHRNSTVPVDLNAPTKRKRPNGAGPAPKNKKTPTKKTTLGLSDPMASAALSDAPALGISLADASASTSVPVAAQSSTSTSGSSRKRRRTSGTSPRSSPAEPGSEEDELEGEDEDEKDGDYNDSRSIASDIIYPSQTTIKPTATADDEWADEDTGENLDEAALKRRKNTLAARRTRERKANTDCIQRAQIHARGVFINEAIEQQKRLAIEAEKYYQDAREKKKELEDANLLLTWVSKVMSDLAAELYPGDEARALARAKFEMDKLVKQKRAMDTEVPNEPSVKGRFPVLEYTLAREEAAKDDWLAHKRNKSGPFEPSVDALNGRNQRSMIDVVGDMDRDELELFPGTIPAAEFLKLRGLKPSTKGGGKKKAS
ncbi:hypothetical protein DL93DRAFT_2102150 [Clavulina sp. PMI_390]|nr:hypothetical protein DL93DRAFT_2102150 [Clavulina sp. PMI_390]